VPFIPTNASPRKNKSEKRPANKRCNSTGSNSFNGFLERDKRVTSPRVEGEEKDAAADDEDGEGEGEDDNPPDRESEGIGEDVQ